MAVDLEREIEQRGWYWTHSGGVIYVPDDELERLLNIELAAQALVDEWHSGDEGPRYLDLREALAEPQNP